MNKRTIQELIDEGYTVYSEKEARQIIADDILFYGLVYDHGDIDHGAIWDIVWNGYKGVDNMTLEDIEDYFVRNTYDDMIAFEWQQVEQQ